MPRSAAASRGALLLVIAAVCACASPRRELESVAKDWCLTIRASQVLPVYPLTEDVQPGDVFLVPTPLSRQAELYEERGFLPLDQLVDRLGPLSYAEFYGDGYWLGPYGKAPHPRPGAPDRAPGAGERVMAPRVAFPTYSFAVERDAGLRLALPISGVPAGLSLMQATRATGSVSIRDAYTYGIDAESMARELYAWWAGDPQRAQTIAAMTQDGAVEVYLRVVTRVYLTLGVTVQLTNLDAGDAQAQAGMSPGVQLVNRAVQDPERAQIETAAYREALRAVSAPFATGGEGVQGPGGAARFLQVSSRAVALDEDFDRPLVIGYRGFDVKVYPDGKLSVPIPSYATLAEGSQALQTAEKVVLGFDESDPTGDLVRDLLRDPDEREAILTWVRQQLGREISASDLISGEDYRDLRALVVEQFGSGEGQGGESR